MIEARGVVVRAGGRTLLDRISLEVAEGEVVALLGANGAGKSTLLAALAGDRTPAAGGVWIGGRDVARMSARELAGRRAVLRQRSWLTAAFTVLEVVQLGQLYSDDGGALVVQPIDAG